MSFSKWSLLLAVGLVLFWTGQSMAEVQTRQINQLPLSAEAVDLTVSADGKRVFVLQDDGNLEIFSIQGEKQGTIAVGKDVTNISAQGETLLLLTRKGKKEVEYLLIDVVQQIKTDGSPRLGRADAPVEIVVFDDFQCPYCAKLAPHLKEAVKQAGGQASLVFKHFPLQMHKLAKTAAEASIAAQQQGKFWEYHDLVFENYNRLTDEKLVDFAKQLKLDMAKFELDRKSPLVVNRVVLEQQEGVKAGVRGTPAVYINGRQFQGERTAQGLLREIQMELSE